MVTPIYWANKLFVVVRFVCLVAFYIFSLWSRLFPAFSPTCIEFVTKTVCIKMDWFQSPQIASQISLSQVQSIMPFTQSSPATEEYDELGLDAKQMSQEATPFHITGFISKPDHGLGRSSADRQFFFINKRPCDLSKVSRVMNEVYHMYNRHQYPFVMVDISLARGKIL